MRRVRLSVVGLMAVVGLLAVNLSIFRALPSIQTMSERHCVVAVLPTVNLLAVLLGLAINGLVIRGEVALSRVLFLLVGGVATFGVLLVTVLSQMTFYEYFDITAGTLQDLLLSTAQKKAIAAGSMAPPMYVPGFGALLAIAVVSPLLLLPALLAGWAARGYRLTLQSTRTSTMTTGPTGPFDSTPPDSP